MENKVEDTQEDDKESKDKQKEVNHEEVKQEETQEEEAKQQKDKQEETKQEDRKQEQAKNQEDASEEVPKQEEGEQERGNEEGIQAKQEKDKQDKTKPKETKQNKDAHEELKPVQNNHEEAKQERNKQEQNQLEQAKQQEETAKQEEAAMQEQVNQEEAKLQEVKNEQAKEEKTIQEEDNQDKQRADNEEKVKQKQDKQEEAKSPKKEGELVIEGESKDRVYFEVIKKAKEEGVLMTKNVSDAKDKIDLEVIEKSKEDEKLITKPETKDTIDVEVIGTVQKELEQLIPNQKCDITVKHEEEALEGGKEAKIRLQIEEEENTKEKSLTSTLLPPEKTADEIESNPLEKIKDNKPKNLLEPTIEKQEEQPKKEDKLPKTSNEISEKVFDKSELNKGTDYDDKQSNLAKGEIIDKGDIIDKSKISESIDNLAQGNNQKEDEDSQDENNQEEESDEDDQEGEGELESNQVVEEKQQKGIINPINKTAPLKTLPKSGEQKKKEEKDTSVTRTPKEKVLGKNKSPQVGTEGKPGVTVESKTPNAQSKKKIVNNNETQKIILIYQQNAYTEVTKNTIYLSWKNPKSKTDLKLDYKSNCFFLSLSDKVKEIQLSLHHPTGVFTTNKIPIAGKTTSNFIYNLTFLHTKCLYIINWTSPPEQMLVSNEDQFKLFWSFIQADKQFYINDLIRDTLQLIQKPKLYDNDLFQTLFYLSCQEEMAFKVFDAFDVKQYFFSTNKIKYNEAINIILSPDSALRKQINLLSYNYSLRSKLNLVGMCYYYINSNSVLSQWVNNSDMNVIEEFIQLIVNDPSDIQLLDLKMLTRLFSFKLNIEFCHKIFSHSKPVEVFSFLKHCHQNCLNYFDNHKVKLSALRYNQLDDFQVMLDILHHLIQAKATFIDTTDVDALLTQFINLNQGVNLNNLLLIKRFVRERQMHSLKEMIKKVLHETGLLFLSDNKCDNLLLLNFLLESEPGELSADDLTSIGLTLKIKTFDEEQKKIFQQLSLSLFPGEHLFIATLLASITELDDFEATIQLFSGFKKVPIQPFLTLFTKLVNSDAKKEEQALLKNIIMLIDFSNANNSNITSIIIITSLQKIIAEEAYISLCITLLHGNNIGSNAHLLIENISELLKPKLIESIINALFRFKQDEMIKIMLNTSTFQELTLQEVHFYMDKDTECFLLFKELVEKDCYARFSTTNYYCATNKSIQSIRKLLEQKDFTAAQIGELTKIDKELLKTRIKCIYYDDQGKGASISEDIISSIQSLIEMKNVMTEVSHYWNHFLKRQEQEKKSIADLSIELNQMKLDQFINEQSKFDKIREGYKEAQKYNQLLSSKFFILIYDNRKEEDEAEKKDKAYEEFTSLSELLTNLNSFITNSPSLVELLFEEVIDRISLEKEIATLSHLLQIQIDDKEQLITNLLLFYTKVLHKQKASSVVFFLEQWGAQQTDFIQTLRQYVQVMETSWNINQIKEMNEKPVIKALAFDKPEYELTYMIFNILNSRKEVISFIKASAADDVRRFYDFLYDGDNSVSKETIEHLLKVVRYITQLKQHSKLADRDLLQECLKQNQEAIYSTIHLNFQNVVDNIYNIKELHNKIEKNDESYYKIINDLHNHSVFRIYFREDQYICEVEGKTFKQILECRDKSLLVAQHQEQNDDDKFFGGICKQFASIMDDIESLFQSIVNLDEKGYPDTLDLSIEVNKGIGKRGDQLLNKVNEFFRNEFDLLVAYQTKGYKENNYINFIYGKQFRTLYECIKSNNLKECDTAFQLIRCITNNKCKTPIEYTYKELSSVQFQDMIMTINDYFIQLTEKNGKTLKDIYNDNIIKADSSYKGIYTVHCLIEEYERTAISWYINLTGSNPMAQTVLLCSDLTSIDEITAFFYRSIQCRERVLFFMIVANTLDLEKRENIKALLKAIYKPESPMISSLFFLYFNKSCDLMGYIKKLQGVQTLNNIDIANLNCKDLNQSITVVSSDTSGIGKSQYIENKIQISNKDYVYFPIGGDFSQRRIVKRLNQLSLQSEKSAIHLDLMDTKKFSQMKHFLFSFLIMKRYSYNENIFFLDDNIDIEIEIPNCFSEFTEQFPILQLFNQKQLKVDNLEPLIVSSDPISESDIQIVCNYFQKEDQLNSHDIFIPFPKLKKPYNALPIDVLSVEECESKIKAKFSITNPTYYQKTSFIKLLATELKMFSQSLYLNISLLRENGDAKNQDLLPVRRLILNSLIQVAISITKGAYSKLISEQKETHEKQKKKENEVNADRAAVDLLNQPESISFDIIKPSLVFFNEDMQSISVITTADKSSEEYKQLRQLINSSHIEDKLELTDFKALTHCDFLSEIKKVLNLRNFATEKEREQKQSSVKSIEAIVGSYVFTADNYIKMIMILLRIRSKIPVIMMGETGCGKTSLIRMIADLSNKKMEILNIHAGTGDEDIISFMNKINDSLETEVQGTNKQPLQDVWVFLDEINTCHSMGLISEMMCKHTMEGKKLSKRIVFIAACNPYRSIKREVISNGLIKNSGDSKVMNLVYNVNPLPFSLLNFIFDFGSLKEEDEKKYIASMLNTPLETIHPMPDPEERKAFIETVTKAIASSQKFIRKQCDMSSVSLREVRRVVILYKWFIDFILRTHPEKNNSQTIQLEAIILSIYICYYLRFFQKDLRIDYRLIIDEIFRQYKQGYSDLLLDIPGKYQNEIIARMNIPSGIAKNRALKENIFALFVCVNNTIPLFICGKPGCSKSLSVQLLNSSMKGEDSQDALFKSLPRIQMTSYQGSLTSTSQGVLSLFQNARQILKNCKDKGKEDIISMIYFDEMGLAEISKNNPLKVIHSQLEYDENKDKVAFVGISNWVLDASKMNRGIFLSIPEFDLEDLIETSQAIASSFGNTTISQNNQLFESLAKTYYDYKARIKTYKSSFADFHGSRDFYHLIKTTVKNIIEKPNSNDSDITRISIERNFGGTEFSVKEFKQLYLKIDSTVSNIPADITGCVTANVLDKESRYLIIISKASRSHFLLDSLLNQLNREYSFYVGSQFVKDKDEDYYSIKILTKIQQCMQQSRVLVLKDLEFIYPSLYDLFNQSFTTYAGQNYSRIAFGLTQTPLTLVHKAFRCIILLDEENIQNKDPPFLNRFEKQIISFENILSQELITLSKTIQKDIKQIYKKKKNIIKPVKINLVCQLLNSELDEIQALLYMMKNEGKVNKQNYSIEVLKKLVPTFSQDLICYMQYSNFQYEQEAKDIYRKDCHQNLYKHLTTTEHYKSIIYTFSSVLDDISFEKTIKTKALGSISSDSIDQMMVSTIKSQFEFETYLNHFFENKQKSVCILKFTPIDFIHLNNIQFIIKNAESEEKVKHNKMFIFIVYYHRVMKDSPKIPLKDRQLMSHLSPFYQLSIDNLNGKDILITDIVKLSSKELYQNKQLIDIEQIYKDNVYYAFMKIRIRHTNGQTSTEADEKLLSFLTNNKTVVKEGLNCIMKHIGKEEDLLINMYFDNAKQNEHKDFKLFNKNEDMITNIELYLLTVFQKQLTGLIMQLEKNSLITDTLLSPDVDEEITNLFINSIQKINLTNMRPSMIDQSNTIDKTLYLYLPGSKQALDELIKHVNTLTNDFYSNEDSLRQSDIDIDDIAEQQNEVKRFQEKEKKLIDNVYYEMQKKPYLSSLLNQDQQKAKENGNKIYQYLEHDYYTIYLANHFSLYSKETIEYIQIILGLRYPEPNNNSYYNLARNILWLESNVSFLKLLIQFFISLVKYKKNLIELINCTLKKKDEIVFETTKNNLEYRHVVNIPFYFIFEALLKKALDDVFSGLKDASFYEYLKILKKMAYSGNQIELNLWFVSKQLIQLQSFVKIFECYAQKDDISEEKLKKHLNNLNQESAFLKESTQVNLINHLKEEYSTLYGEFKGLSNFPKVYISILIEKYKSFGDKSEFRKEILKIVLLNNEMVQESSPLLLFYFENYSISDIPEVKEDEEETLEEYFMTFKNEQDSPLQALNDSGSKVVQEFLLFYFQKAINIMFINQSKEKGGLNLKEKGVLFKCFSFSIDYIVNFLNKNDILSQLSLLYAIGFVKVYLSYYVLLSIQDSNQIDFSGVDKIIVGEGPDPIRQVIKIYILKLFNHHLGWEELCLIKKKKEKYQITWADQFVLETEDSDDSFVDYLFISELRNSKGYSDVKKRIATTPSDFMTSKNILLFFDISIYASIRSHKAGREEENSTIVSQINKSNLSNLSTNLKKLLVLLYDPLHYNSFVSQIDYKDIEMWLYCYRLCLLCVNSSGSWYKEIFNNDLASKLSDAFIPGGEIAENSRLTQTAIQIQKFFKDNILEGVYICSCDTYYTVGNCGNVKVISTCVNCGKEIGGIYHSMIKREGHVRVFPTEEKMKLKLTQYGDYEQGFWGDNYEEEREEEGRKFTFHKASILFDELKQRAMEQINNEAIKGIVKVSYNFFISSDKWMREMNQVSYRLLSLILYSLLFFGNSINLISKEICNGLLPQGKSLIDIIKVNWDLLKKELNKMDIGDTQIFLNLISDDFNALISRYSRFDSIDKRLEFEKAMNDLVLKAQMKYKEYVPKYKEINTKMLQYNHQSAKSIIKELESPDVYLEHEYPYLRYFMREEYPTRASLQEKLSNICDSQSKYPILSKYFDPKSNIEYLSNLVDINPFANYMLNKYSYCLIRTEGKDLKIKNELGKIDNKSVNTLYDKYEKAFNNTKSNENRYQCHLLDQKTLSSNDSIAFCLNDNGENGYGMQLAARYLNFIEWQNDFLTPVITQNNLICNYFKDSISQGMMVQDATKNEIVAFSIDDNSSFSSFEELINSFSHKDCFEKNDSINYSNYRSVSFDIDMIEETLAKILLPGKRLFDSKQRFVNYGYEGCRGENSPIITEFLEKYPQEALTSQQEQLLFQYQYKNAGRVDRIMFSMHMLIFYIYKHNFLPSKPMIDIINSLPDYVNPECKGLFNKTDNFKVNQLIKIFEYFEQLCFKTILKNINTTEQVDIPEATVLKIKEFAKDSKGYIIINKINLSTATRRFISRKLCGQRADTDVKSDSTLFEYLINAEYWSFNEASIIALPEFDKKKSFEQVFEEEFFRLSAAFGLLVTHAVDLYKKLEGDESLLIKKLENKEEEDNSQAKASKPKKKFRYK